ncbi:MAG: hypothetical protein JSU70_11610, partial [Phycisphaerales bacterium]
DESSATHPDSPWRGDVWSFTIPPLTAWRPNPPDGSVFIDPNVSLTWFAGMGAVMHQVYFGDDLDDVSDADVSDTTGIYRGPRGAGQESYGPGPLEFEKVYYWRIDEFDGSATHEGDVWSFTTTVGGLGAILREVWEDIGGDAVADLTGNPSFPDNPSWSDEITEFDFWDLGLDSYGARLRGWLYVPAAGDYTFWITGDNGSELWLSADDDPGGVGTAPIAQVPGTNWTGHYEWEKFPEQQSAPIKLETDRYYIEALLKEGGGGDGLVVAWQGPAAPEREVIPGMYLKPFEALWASGPNPANRATGVTQSPTLSWNPGEKAIQHDVYFGTDYDVVADADTTTTGVYRGRQALALTEYIPPEAPLEWDTDYYWRIDEVNTLDPDGLWKGSVWRFTVADFIAVDDFEDYNDYSPDRIFQTWIDGFGYSEPAPGKQGNGTGSTVGYLSAPFAEQTIVHGGGQSMPFGYDNTGTTGKARYSEAEREFPVAQNFMRKGVKSLSLWVYGDPASVPATLYVGLQDTAGTRMDVPDTSDSRVQTTSWQEVHFDLSKFAPVNLASIKKIYIGVGSRLSPSVGGTGSLFVDDIRLYLPRCRASVLKPEADLNSDCIVDYLDVEIVANAWLSTGLVVTPQQPSTTGLVGYYSLENNTQDGSGSGHDGTALGAPIFVPGPAGFGMGMQFDGTGSQYVDLGTWDPTAGTGQLTAALWLKWHGLSGFYQGLIAKRDTWAEDDMMWQVEANVDTGDISAGRESGQGVGGYGVAVVGEWEHLALSFDGTTATLYRDGTQVGSGAFSLGPDTESALVFGAVEANGGNPYNGALDEVRLYNRPLSHAEIAWLAGKTEPFSAVSDLNVDDTVDFLDVAILGDTWLDEALWPQP